MEKRFITFIVLSFLILVGWQFAVSYFYPEAVTPSKDLKTTSSTTPSPSTSSTPQSSENATSTVTPTTSPIETTSSVPIEQQVNQRKLTIKTSQWNATFDNRGALLTSLSIHHLGSREIKGSDYSSLELVSQEGLQKVGAPLRFETETTNFTKILNESNYSINEDAETIILKDGETREIVFTLKNSSGIEAEKRLKIIGGKSTFDFQAKVLNNNQALAAKLLIGPNFGDQSVKAFDVYVNTPPQTLIVQNTKTNFLTGTELERTGDSLSATKTYPGNADWVAVIDHYFAMAVIPPDKTSNAVVYNNFIKENDNTYKGMLSVAIPVVNDQPYLFFIAPKDRDLLATLSVDLLKNKHDLEVILNYGYFAFMVRPFIPVLDLALKGIYKVTYNYGWAIILITLLINVIFFPLKWKSAIAMERAKKMQPKYKEIQEKLKKLKPDDPRAVQLQSEMMQIFKEGNPLAGCLPLLLQLPIFWAVYIYLSMSVNVRHSPFIFWVKDLSVADPTYILPIIMTVASMAATAIMPTPATNDDPAQKMQKVMMTYVMPIIFFVAFFKSAPSGLVLYWMFNSVFGVALQLIINKFVAEPTPAVTK
ncbi:MAG: membrane protein insertase YidC [Acidobacteria bacterium]|nr:membrane protein insertase YidC [Acidobacteriota bacterium]